eukprot:IDg12407t1
MRAVVVMADAVAVVTVEEALRLFRPCSPAGPVRVAHVQLLGRRDHPLKRKLGALQSSKEKAEMSKPFYTLQIWRYCAHGRLLQISEEEEGENLTGFAADDDKYLITGVGEALKSPSAKRYC